MPSVASQNFAQLVGFVDQLIMIHGRLQAGRGRRHEQDAIHRAGVVMMIAAWESYVERVVLEGFLAIETSAGIASIPLGMLVLIVDLEHADLPQIDEITCSDLINP